MWILNRIKSQTWNIFAWDFYETSDQFFSCSNVLFVPFQKDKKLKVGLSGDIDKEAIKYVTNAGESEVETRHMWVIFVLNNL